MGTTFQTAHPHRLHAVTLRDCILSLFLAPPILLQYPWVRKTLQDVIYSTLA